MNTHVTLLVKYLSANDAPGTMAEHLEAITQLHSELVRAAANFRQSAEIADAIFGYMANHHCFDLDSVERTRQIAEVMFELICPLAADDSRSKLMLAHLSTEVPKRVIEIEQLLPLPSRSED